MKNYTADQLVKLDSEQIERIQKNYDSESLEYIDAQNENLNFLSPSVNRHLREYYTDTMEKYRLLYEAIVYAFETPSKPGFPEYIYNIDLKTGEIETDKNGRRISYSTEVLAPCTTSMLHYINSEDNDVYVVIPPIKNAERTTEKIISECHREYDQTISQNIIKLDTHELEDEPEFPFTFSKSPDNTLKLDTPTDFALLVERGNEEEINQKSANALLNIAKANILPKDIYRLSITSKYVADLDKLIKKLEDKFPDYIKFEKGERNSYKKNLSENKRDYFDIKKTAEITIPGSQRKFKIEFQFKQTNMFFAHIRSHSAYEDYRVLEAKYLAAKEGQKKKPLSPEAKAKIPQLKKQCDEKKELCLQIHRNAVHQSNMYLMNKLLWIDDNSRGLHRTPEYEDGKYELSVKTLKENFIVNNTDEPFDGATIFTTGPNEYLNKSCYLKLIGILPESFDELGKNAKIHINKAWDRLTEADHKNFDRITNIAIKYQDVIRSIQKKRKMMDNSSILQVFAQNSR